MRPLLPLLLLCFLAPLADAGSIVATKHNLSATGPGSIKAATETEVCIFCHTPHSASQDAPLWNRASSGATYKPYTSSTSKALAGQPTGDSKLCLSCHDGTIALGMVRSRAQIAMSGGTTVMPSGKGLIGTDLSNDHPISFAYTATLAATRGQLQSPASLTGPVHLDANGQMQCTSCHDPHNNQYGSFLVMNNNAASLCTTCHSRDYWSASDHRNSTKSWNGAGANPWPDTGRTTVQANGCENCHTPHAAGTPQRSLSLSGIENTCFACHNGNVAAKNLQSEFNKASIHPVLTTGGSHDPTEDPVNPTRHVSCADCHNPHAANSAAAVAPAASGALSGVKGVSATGAVADPLSNEYELCFRCHADSSSRGVARVTRQNVQTNTRLEFASTNASYHSVVAAGRATSVPSLIAPWTATSRMYCTDCHNNDAGSKAGGTGPNGPHGSAYTPLLERKLLLTDNSTYSAANFALCYKCHSSTSILGDASFRYHNKHVSGEKTACTTCHDSHGGGSNKGLINFNTTYVTPLGGVIKFTSTSSGSTFHGTCTLVCHGEQHSNFSY